MATQEFKIMQFVEGYPSKNKVYFEGTEQECKDELQGLISLTKRHGGDIQEESEYTMVVDNYDRNSATHTFEIIEK